jgi:hypothetical protein
MHWLVEVSRVGDTVASERYCIDARRWQSALQEARRMRGDSGALPRLTIELTDNGYRAVDPELAVRYVVSEAPPDMPLTDGARTVLSTHPPPVGSVPPPNPVPTLASPPAPVAVNPPIVTASTAPFYPERTSAPVVRTAAPASDPTASAGGTPTAPLARTPSSPPPSSPSGPSSGSAAPPLSAQVIRQREEKPTEASPIAYRELALAVKAGALKSDVEAVLRARLEEIAATLPADSRRFVQLAVFDHVFVKRPVRPPLGVLVWKDWRGEPTLSFPGFGEADDGPPPSSMSTVRTPSWSATSIPPLAPSIPATGASAPAPPATAPLAPAPSTPPVAAPTPAAASVPPAASAPARPVSVQPSRVVSVGPSKPPPAENAPAATPVEPVPAPAVTSKSDAPRAADAAVPARSAAPAALSSEPAPRRADSSGRRSDPPSRRSDPPSRRSNPNLAPPRRRGPGEDLISELFDRMGDLMFMGDLPSGADYVLNVLFELIPCEGMLVHVFDLGRREFVVVRAHGPSMRKALLFRTPDSDPVVLEVMRQRSVVSNGAAPVHSAAFERLGVQAKQVLSAAARQGGRYLGFIELANPSGGAPFHDAEKHALEYVCEQFAEFVASRPLILDEDIVLRA